MKHYSCGPLRPSNFQRGISLIELLIGIALGLLTIAVAISALVISRSLSGAVSDTTIIQQQAAHAFRVMGRQIRQAGPIQLDMGADSEAPVAFSFPSGNFNAVRGEDATDSTGHKVTVAYSHNAEPLYPSGNPGTLLTDCLGSSPDGTLVQSAFELRVSKSEPSKRELVCKGKADSTQPVVENVAEFEVRYLLQTSEATAGDPHIAYVTASSVGNKWADVTAVEICLVLYGHEHVDMPDGASYTGCGGSSVDITTLPAPRTKRTHLRFRNVFQLRSQGVTGAR